jgi:ketosteroid isomerase-like protein
MSQTTVDLARKGIEAWNQRDADLWLTYAAPEIEWIPAGPAAVEQAVYSGHDEAARGLAAVWDTWEVFEFVESEVRDLGDSVLWLGHVKMRGGTSHVELDQEFALHSQVRDGRLIRVKAFLSWQDALQEADGAGDA